MSEQTTNPIDALNSLINARLLDINTSIPATIVSYSGGGKARVQPKPKKRFSDGDILDYPIIPNVRVCWPSFAGGMAGVKGPIKPGDNCLLVFSQQAVDGSDDRRMFDLQDAYAVMCDLGNVESDSANNDNMTMYFGEAYIRLTEDGALHIFAPGGTTINTPSTINTGTLTTNDTLTYLNGMEGFGGSGNTTIQGNINHTAGTITSLGKRIDGSHTHNETGSVTLAPNA